MDHEVLGPDRREAIAAVLADALGKARIVGLELEIAPVERDELAQFVQRQHAFDDEHLVFGDLELLGDEVADAFVHGGFDLEADDAAAAAALQGRLVKPDQVLGLFLELDIRIAHDPESAPPLHRVAGKQPAGEQHDGLFQRDEARRSRLGEIGQPDEALRVGRQADQRVQEASVRLAKEPQGDGEAEIGDEGKGMRRVDRERRQDGEDVLEEMLLEPQGFGTREVGAVDEHDALVQEVILQLAPAPLLVRGEAGDRGRNLGELLGRREAVLRGRRHARAHLADKAGDAHHEEFVEVVGRDRQEAQLLEQRVALVGRLLEHATVELQPRQFAVDEARRAVAQRRPVGAGIDLGRRTLHILQEAVVEGQICAHRASPEGRTVGGVHAHSMTFR